MVRGSNVDGSRRGTVLAGRDRRPNSIFRVESAHKGKPFLNNAFLECTYIGTNAPVNSKILRKFIQYKTY